jgi:hypothetical protein
MTTVWCEVTSSVNENDEPETVISDSASEERRSKKPPPSTVKVNSSAPSESEDKAPEEEIVRRVKELLLCLRPIQDKDIKLDENYNLVSDAKTDSKRLVSDSSVHASAKSQPILSPGAAKTTEPHSSVKDRSSTRPMKKRKRASDEEQSSMSPHGKSSKVKSEDDNDAIECLMRMSTGPSST